RGQPATVGDRETARQRAPASRATWRRGRLACAANRRRRPPPACGGRRTFAEQARRTRRLLQPRRPLERLDPSAPSTCLARVTWQATPRPDATRHPAIFDDSETTRSVLRSRMTPQPRIKEEGRAG